MKMYVFQKRVRRSAKNPNLEISKSHFSRRSSEEELENRGAGGSVADSYNEVREKLKVSR